MPVGRLSMPSASHLASSNSGLEVEVKIGNG